MPNNTPAAKKPQFSVALQTDGYQRLIRNTLSDPKVVQRFTASISSVVAVNPELQECDVGSILTCGLLGEALGLSPSPQLGHFYFVPFNDNRRGRKVATFILGYKGYIQLAIRSGQYKRINVLAIKKGELINYDPLAEEIEVKLIQDELARETAETTGYYAMFEYVNGFRKALYWSKDKMEQHALRYSKGYKAKKGYTFWEKDFDGMAYKTMLRQLISKWGIMSIEMVQAFEADNAAVNQDLSADIVTAGDIDDTAVGVAAVIDGDADVVDNSVANDEDQSDNVTMDDL
ncbi:MAG: recombinase RecT [Oscillospiraceae bacterium]|nr:recombinase RecT [Oscillospiraceae bacterium]